jgi:hypothetical protein
LKLKNYKTNKLSLWVKVVALVVGTSTNAIAAALREMRM